MSESSEHLVSPSQLADVVESASRSMIALFKEMPAHQQQARLTVRLGSYGSVELQIGHAGTAPVTDTTWPVLLTARPKGERVAEAKRLLSEGAVYPQGCSQFVCAVLGIPYELANALMGTSPPSRGSAPPYADLSPGDIAGWISTTGSGHVAIYVGESADVAFIDVREPGARPRSKNGHYSREIFESTRF